MKAPKVIPTEYNGVRFRSRLEARWAIFFDAIGVDYVYEPEGIVCDGLCYLVDFWLPRPRMFAEVKPQWLNETEDRKMKMLVIYTGKPCLVLEGLPDFRQYTAMQRVDLNGSYEVFWCNYVFDPALFADQGRFFGDPPEKQFQAVDDFCDEYRTAVYAAQTYQFGREVVHG